MKSIDMAGGSSEKQRLSKKQRHRFARHGGLTMHAHWRDIWIIRACLFQMIFQIRRGKSESSWPCLHLRARGLSNYLKNHPYHLLVLPDIIPGFLRSQQRAWHVSSACSNNGIQVFLYDHKKEKHKTRRNHWWQAPPSQFYHKWSKRRAHRKKK